MLLTLLSQQASIPVDPPVDVAANDCWGGAWGSSWGDSWGGVTATARYSAEIDLSFPRLVRQVSHKSEIAPKVRKLIKQIARKAAATPIERIENEQEQIEQEVEQEYAQDLQETPAFDYWQALLINVLSEEEIAWNAFYADLLQQQINDQIAAQIRRLFEIGGVYQQIEDDDEQALIMMMMEL